MMVCGVDEGVEVCRNSSKRTYTMKILVSTTRTSETTYRKHTECHSGGSGQGVQATAQKSSSGCTVGSNAPLNVPVVMPKHAAKTQILSKMLYKPGLLTASRTLPPSEIFSKAY